MIEISKIRMDGGTQSRAAISDETVLEYAEAMADPDTVFPPITVYYDGQDYWLADGFHRVAAWKRTGRAEVPAVIHQGDRRRAILHSLAANACHGLRRTNDDKRRAVTTLLEDDEWSQWSNREIARRCAVSDPFVAKMRGELSANGSQMTGERTVQRGDTVYTQNTTNIGARSNPDQDREIANTSSATEPEPDRSHTGAGSEPEENAAPDPNRKGLSSLSREGLEDEVAGLRAALADEIAARKAVEAERDELKQRVRDLSEANQGRAISRLHAQIVTLKGAQKDAMAKAAKETRRANFFEAELKKARKSLEGQEVEI